MHRISNEVLRIGNRPSSGVILLQRLRWLGHTFRMPDQGLPHSVFSAAINQKAGTEIRLETITWWSSNDVAPEDERINKKVSHRWFLSFTWLGTERSRTRMAEYPRGYGQPLVSVALLLFL